MKCVLAYFSSLWSRLSRWYADLRSGQIKSARYELTGFAIVTLFMAFLVWLA